MYIIEDKIQTYLQYENWSLLRDIILIILVYIFYTNVEFNLFQAAIKYYIIFLIIRYLISIITTVTKKENTTTEKYFQISAHVGLFTILMLLFSMSHVPQNADVADKVPFINQTSSWVIILAYGLLNIATQKHYFYDILSTILLVNYLFTIDYFKQSFLM